MIFYNLDTKDLSVGFLVLDVRFGLVDGWYFSRDAAEASADYLSEFNRTTKFCVLECKDKFLLRLGDFALLNRVGLLDGDSELTEGILSRLLPCSSSKSHEERFRVCVKVADSMFEALAEVAVDCLPINKPDAQQHIACHLRLELLEILRDLINEPL